MIDKAGTARVEDEQAIRSQARDFVDAWNSHDAKRMAAKYAEDGALADPFGTYAMGRSEIEKAFTALHAGSAKDSTTTLEVKTVQFLRPDVALVDLEQIATGMLDPAGTTILPTRFLARTVLVKRDASWSYRWVAVILPVPPPPPRA